MTVITSPPGRLMSETEAAIALNVSIRTLQGWRVRGGGPSFVKLGASVRYAEADLTAFIDAGRRRHTAQGAA